MDTQWEKYEVFEKEREDLPHRNAGAVHAPDGEMALENARDVFVRRPNCLSLWVLPERAVYAKTVQELAEEQVDGASAQRAAAETYLVFQKQGQTARETYVVHVGEVMANSSQAALKEALGKFSHRDVAVWWVVPARAVIRSEEADAPSWFDPANGKRYRNHLAYPVEGIMRELKSLRD